MLGLIAKSEPTVGLPVTKANMSSTVPNKMEPILTKSWRRPVHDRRGDGAGLRAPDGHILVQERRVDRGGAAGPLDRARAHLADALLHRDNGHRHGPE